MLKVEKEVLDKIVKRLLNRDIKNKDILYFCFPTAKCDVVAKARLATEELYKIVSKKRK